MLLAKSNMIMDHLPKDWQANSADNAQPFLPDPGQGNTVVQSLQLYCAICYEVTFLCARQSSLRLDDISVLKLVNTCENFSVEHPYMYPGCEVTRAKLTWCPLQWPMKMFGCHNPNTFFNQQCAYATPNTH